MTFARIVQNLLLVLGGLAMMPSCVGSTEDRRHNSPESDLGENECAGDVPVLMVISGRTLDRERMAEYSRALAASGLYLETGGEYLNEPRPLQTLEGELERDFVTLVVRFPSECAAIRFWQSDTYQREIKPLRENPPASDYSVILYKALA